MFNMSMSNDDDLQLRIRGAFADMQYLVSHIHNAQVSIATQMLAIRWTALQLKFCSGASIPKLTKPRMMQASSLQMLLLALLEGL